MNTQRSKEESAALLIALGFQRNGDGRLCGPCPFCSTKKGFSYHTITALWSCQEGCFRSGELPELIELVRKRVATRAADVESETVRWLWSRRIPFGKITLIDGDPGLGKSILTLEIAARVSRGQGLPDGELVAVGNVLLLAAEDGLADTIRPRLEAADADLDRVHILGHEGRPWLFPKDLARLGAIVDINSAHLLVIDPLMAHLESTVNSHRDQDVRSLVMAPLARIGEKTSVAIVIVRHLNKGATANPLYRGGGSIGFAGAARSGLLVAADPDDENRRVLAPLKSNLCMAPKSLGFEIIESSPNVPKIEWLGESGYRAGSLLHHADNPASDEDRDAVTKACEWLVQTLADGRIESKELGELANGAQISKSTLWRAKAKLNIKAQKNPGKDGSWFWRLPEDVRADLHPSRNGDQP